MVLNTLLFYSALVFTNGLTHLCIIHTSTNFMDCSFRNLNKVPRFHNIPFNCTTLSLRNNNIKEINVSVVLRDLPFVKVILLYGNPLNCSDTLLCLQNLVVVLSHCNCLSKPTNIISTTPLPLSSTRFQSSTTGISTIYSTLYIAKHSYMIDTDYMVLIIVSILILILGSLIMYYIMIHCAQSKRSRASGIQMHVIDNMDMDEEEDDGEQEVLFIREHYD